MSDWQTQAHAMMKDKPSGDLTPTGTNGLAVDELGRPFRYKSLEQEKAIEKEKQKRKDKRHFSFTHMGNIREYTDSLSNKYCGYILLLQPHIQFKTNVLVVSNKDETPLTDDQIADIIGVTKRTVQKVIQALKDNDILTEQRNGKYVMNERYHFRKKAKSDVDALIKTYFTTLKTLKLTPADLGFVYKLLPYIHYDSNLVCDNPFAPSDEIEYLNAKQIAKKIGMSESKTKEAMERLRKAGAIGEFTRREGDKREKLTVLNPFVFYRKRDKPDATLVAMFSAKGSTL
jgi:biotin operon repressor